MADEQSMSVKHRIAQLKLHHVARLPDTSTSASHDQVIEGTTWTRTRRPPTPPPPAPARPHPPHPPPRPNSVGVPTAQNGSIGNQPEGDHEAATTTTTTTNGPVRPPLPSRPPTSQSLSAPSLPPRRMTSDPSPASPASPPRRPSETPSSSDDRLARRDSSESISSVATGRSSLSGVSTTTSITSGRSVKAPVFDPNALPALPPKRTEEEKRSYYDSGYQKSARRPLKSTYSSPNILPRQSGTTAPPTPRRPSTRQAQLSSSSEVESASESPVRQMEPAPAPALSVRPPPPQLPSRHTATPQPPARQLQPPASAAERPPPVQPPRPKQSALAMGFGSSTPKPTPPLPSRPDPSATTNGITPPPIPTSSRPDLAALQASKPKPNTSTPLCLHCRDFTHPDHHATQFPRQNNQSLSHLAHALTSPFPSPTDKARAIFTWLHHNIRYDTAAFFSGHLTPSTPQSTLATGLAVCEGYAGLFAALAMSSGLEALVVGGHGKGYGYRPLGPHDPIPAPTPPATPGTPSTSPTP
ncbi:Transglutaminase-like superfamily, partial [Teratosphaeria destructans]